VKFQPEERLVTTSELNLAPGGVTYHREARGMGCRAATQVKGLSPEITIVSEADGVHLLGRQYSHNRYWQGYASPTGSETVARHQMNSVGTREAQCISRSFGICDDKPINGKESQMMHWESDQLIVVMKQGNACGAKGLAGKPWNGNTSSALRGGQRKTTKPISVTSSPPLAGGEDVTPLPL